MRKIRSGKNALFIFEAYLLFITLLCLIPLFVLFKSGLLFKILIAVIGIFYLLAAFVYIPAFLFSYEITVNLKSIEIFCGVFFKTKKIMPKSSIVYCSVISSPLLRRQNTYLIIFKSSRFSVITLPIDEEDVFFIKGAIGGLNEKI